MPSASVQADRREHALGGRRAVRADVHEHEAAGAVGVLGHARREAGLAEQRRLLVAGDAATRGCRPGRRSRPTVTPKRPLDGRTSGSASRGTPSSSHSSALPRQRGRCRRASCGWRWTDRWRSTSPPVRFHSSQAVDRAERQVGRPAGHAALGAAATPSSWPRSTGRAPGRCARAPGRGGRRRRASSQRPAVRRSCHTMARCSGCAGAAVPGHDGLALVGDADGGDRLVRARPSTSSRVAWTASPDLDRRRARPSPGWGKCCVNSR